MLTLKRTNSDDPDFIELVHLLDEHLLHQYGEEMNFYGKFNKIDKIKHAVIAYVDGEAAGCGAIREYAEDTIEVKRMFVKEAFRGQQIGKAILQELEIWAKELAYPVCILETGPLQLSAIAMYKKMGFKVIPNYGPYINVESSICMKKILG